MARRLHGKTIMTKVYIRRQSGLETYKRRQSELKTYMRRQSELVAYRENNQN